METIKSESESESVNHYVKETEPEDLLTSAYIAQMGQKEKTAYHIAKEHLGTSFNLKKSIGYKEWLKNKEKNTS
jgi:hypothetical protein